MKIRQARVTDAKDIAIIGIKTWQTAYKGIFPENKLQEMDVQERTERWKNNIIGILKEENSEVLVVEEERGKVVGFAAGGIYPDTKPYDCSIGAIYVLNEFQGRGVGSMLVKGMLVFFESQQFKSMIIWVLEENPYKRFYAKLGGEPRERSQYEKWEIKKEIVGYVWDDIEDVQLDVDN